MPSDDVSFTHTARKIGAVPLFKALVDVWGVIGSFLGLSGGFCFFVLFANPSFQDTQYMSKEVAQAIVTACLSVSFGLSYLGSGWCMTFIGNASYIIQLSSGGCHDAVESAMVKYVAANELTWSIPAYLNFIVIMLTMFSLAIFSFSNFPMESSVLYAVIAIILILAGFLVSRKVMLGRNAVVAVHALHTIVN